MKTIITSIERIHLLAAALGLQGEVCIGPIDLATDAMDMIVQPGHKWFASFRDKNRVSECRCCSDVTMTGAVLRIEDKLRERVQTLLDEYQTRVDLARDALGFTSAENE